jgi:hypothetical protein
MFVDAIAGLSLIIAVSIAPGASAPDTDDSLQRLSAREKTAVIRPLVDDATTCVAHVVAADPRLGKSEVTELIVDSFRVCAGPVRALIDAHDRYYGSGSGEEFFMGPYLDALPAAVINIVGKTPPR